MRESTEIRNDVVRKPSEHDFLRQRVENSKLNRMSDNQLHLRGGAGDEDQIEYDYHTSLYTRKGGEIDIYLPCAGTDASVVSEQDESAFLRDLGIGQNQIQKLEDADPEYNCHLYTFTKDKDGWITESDDVRMILQDHKYQEIPEESAGKGLKKEQRDIAIYSQNDEIPHSGRVAGRHGDRPLIDSKLGKYGVYRHRPEILTENYGEVSYYRSYPGISSTIS